MEPIVVTSSEVTINSDLAMPIRDIKESMTSTIPFVDSCALLGENKEFAENNFNFTGQQVINTTDSSSSGTVIEESAEDEPYFDVDELIEYQEFIQGFVTENIVLFLDPGNRAEFLEEQLAVNSNEVNRDLITTICNSIIDKVLSQSLPYAYGGKSLTDVKDLKSGVDNIQEGVLTFGTCKDVTAKKAKVLTINKQQLANIDGKSKPDPTYEIPQYVIDALALDDDKVADLVIAMVGYYVKCTDLKHDVVWFYNDITKLWMEGTTDCLANVIMKVVRPEIERFVILQRGKSGEDAESRRKKMESLAYKLGNLKYCMPYAKVAKLRLYDISFVDRLDSNSDLLPVKNGKVLDLRTGECRYRTHLDYCSFECPVVYDPNARSDDIDNFIDAFCCGRQDLKLFLQEVFGLCLTGYTHAQQMYILYNNMGANGKSTFMNLLRGILGGYCVQAHREVFLQADRARAGSASPHLAELRGARLAIFCETVVGDKINEGQIKAFTGNDKIKCRPLYKSDIEFTPRFKAIILCNNKPECSTDQALWRRLIMIPCDARFVPFPRSEFPNEKLLDTKFTERVLNSPVAMSALLNWLVAGTIRIYNQTTSALPQCVVETTNEYKAEQDIYVRFLNERVDTTTDASLHWRYPVKDFNDQFLEWCVEENLSRPDNKVFAPEFQRHLGKSHVLRVDGKNTKCYINCRLKVVDAITISEMQSLEGQMVNQAILTSVNVVPDQQMVINVATTRSELDIISAMTEDSDGKDLL